MVLIFMLHFAQNYSSTSLGHSPKLLCRCSEAEMTLILKKCHSYLRHSGTVVFAVQQKLVLL